MARRFMLLIKTGDFGARDGEKPDTFSLCLFVCFAYHVAQIFNIFPSSHGGKIITT